MNKHELLKNVFGYEDFRPGQEELIDCLLNGQDVLGIMPTGAGKSLCYQIPALVMDGITLVISPLISLMKDQVGALTQAGISAAYLNSSLSQKKYDAALTNAERGKYKIIYVAPERLHTPLFEHFVKQAHIACLIVDEAHCVSQWGHDFRSSYLDISGFANTLQTRPVVGAFTATATEKVRKDIITLLALHNPYVLVTGFNRENLYFETQTLKDKNRELLRLLHARPGKSGIIYCATRANVEEVCTLLNQNGFSATRYHAGLSQNERHDNQNNFVYDHKQVMVATNAFGMGIDKSNVSFVVHYNMPKNIESYYQEAGRAGRDGEPADCILLYSARDVQINRFLINSGIETNEELSSQDRENIKQNDLALLKAMTWYSTGTECLRRYILQYFGESAPIYCGNCSNCNRHYDEVNITEDTQKIISCVARVERMGRTAGKTMIANILHGTDTIKISKNGYETLPTYGIMAEVSVRRIVHTIEFLVSQGYLSLSDDDYPVLFTNANSARALRGERPIMIKLPRENASTETSGKKVTDTTYNEVLFNDLAVLRLKLARKQRVPAYTIFTDATLRDMCKKLPQTEAEFLDVSGVGEAKLKKYSADFLQLIRRYTEKAAKASSASKGGELPSANGSAGERIGYHAWTQEEDEQLKSECRSGFTISEMSQIHSRSSGAIRSRIKKLEIQ